MTNDQQLMQRESSQCRLSLSEGKSPHFSVDFRSAKVRLRQIQYWVFAGSNLCRGSQIRLRPPGRLSHHLATLSSAVLVLETRRKSNADNILCTLNMNRPNWLRSFNFAALFLLARVSRTAVSSREGEAPAEPCSRCSPQSNVPNVRRIRLRRTDLAVRATVGLQAPHDDFRSRSSHAAWLRFEILATLSSDGSF